MTKGFKTKQAILEQALYRSGDVGLGGLTIGGLAKEFGISKSGLFRHFGSKEELQLATLKLGFALFEERIVRKSSMVAAGVPHLRALFQNWIDWTQSPGMRGRCFVAAGSSEFDSRPGAIRDALGVFVSGWVKTLEGSVSDAISNLQLRCDADPRQFAFSMHAHMLAFTMHARLLGDSQARSRASLALENLIDSYRVQS